MRKKSTKDMIEEALAEQKEYYIDLLLSVQDASKESTKAAKEIAMLLHRNSMQKNEIRELKDALNTERAAHRNTSVDCTMYYTKLKAMENLVGILKNNKYKRIRGDNAF